MADETPQESILNAFNIVSSMFSDDGQATDQLVSAVERDPLGTAVALAFICKNTLEAHCSLMKSLERERINIQGRFTSDDPIATLEEIKNQTLQNDGGPKR